VRGRAVLVESVEGEMADPSWLASLV
jgi:hypothetical protein